MKRKIFICEGKNIFGKYFDYFNPNANTVEREYLRNALRYIQNDSHPITLEDVLKVLKASKIREELADLIEGLEYEEWYDGGKYSKIAGQDELRDYLCEKEAIHLLEKWEYKKPLSEQKPEVREFLENIIL